MTNHWLKTSIAIIIMVVMVFYPINAAYSLEAALFYLKEFVIDLIARFIARIIMNAMNDGIVGKVNTLGRGGGGAIIRDWRRFQQESQRRGEDLARTMIAQSDVCDYLRDPIDDIFNSDVFSGVTVNVNGIMNQVFELLPFNFRVNCTTSLSAAGVDAFMADFNAGGWTAWEQLIQPENNLNGLFALSFTELERQRVFTQSSDVIEGAAGSGFVSNRGQGSDGCLVQCISGECIVWNDILSSGDTLAGALKSTI